MILGICPARCGVLSGARFFKMGVCLSVTFLIVDLWQYYVCCICPGATLCTLVMVPYLCQSVSHAAFWWHIGILMRLLAAETRSTAGLLFPSRYLCGTILLTLYSMLWNWRVLRDWQMFFFDLSCSPLCLLLFYLSLFTFYVLVLWGWGLRTDRV